MLPSTSYACMHAAVATRVSNFLSWVGTASNYWVLLPCLARGGWLPCVLSINAILCRTGCCLVSVACLPACPSVCPPAAAVLASDVYAGVANLLASAATSGAISDHVPSLSSSFLTMVVLRALKSAGPFSTPASLPNATSVSLSICACACVWVRDKE